MLERLQFNATEDTPELILDVQSQIFKISGRSMPEDATAFFAPIYNWLLEYVKNPNPKTEFFCNMEYFNSSSAKKIVEMFFILERIKEKEVRIIWYYEEDDRLIETKGHELKAVLNIPVDLVQVDPEL